MISQWWDKSNLDYKSSQTMELQTRKSCKLDKRYRNYHLTTTTSEAIYHNNGLIFMQSYVFFQWSLKTNTELCWFQVAMLSSETIIQVIIIFFVVYCFFFSITLMFCLIKSQWVLFHELIGTWKSNTFEEIANASVCILYFEKETFVANVTIRSH